MESMDLFLNIHNSLVDTLKQTQTVMQQFNTKLEISANKFQNIGNTGEKINDEYTQMVKHQSKLNVLVRAWERIWGSIKGLFSSFAGKVATIFSVANIIDATKMLLDYNTKLKHLSYRMGEGNKATAQLTNAMFKIAKATGIAVDKAGDLVIALRKMRVATKDIAELGTVTQKFTEITGLSATSAQRLAGELIRTGKVGIKATEGIMASMVKVQRVIGLTSDEMEQLNETIIYSTRILHQYGKSSAEIEKFNKGVVKLTAAFSSVGVKADEANKIIDDLLDPSRIEDNALLYAKLGVSIQDVISGNIDPGTLTKKFKQLGQELKGMGNMAAAQLARQLGMPLSELRAMADIDMSKVNKSMEQGANAAQAIDKAWREQLSPQEKFQKTMENIKTSIASLANKFLVPILNKAANFISKNMGKIQAFFNKLPGIFEKVKTFALKIFDKKLWLGAAGVLILLVATMRRKFLAVSADFSKSLEEGVVKALEMGTKKQKIIAQKTAETTARSIDLQTRIMQSEGYKYTQEVADKLEAMAKSNLFPAVARMTENTAQWLRNISMGSHPVSLIEQLTKETNKYIEEQLEFAKQEKAIRQGVLDTQLHQKQLELEQVQRRKQQIDYDNASFLRKLEYNKLMRQEERLQKQINKLSQESNSLNARTEELYAKVVRRLGPQELKLHAESLLKQKETYETSIKQTQQKLEELNLYKRIALEQKKGLEEQLKSLGDVNKLTGEDLKQYGMIYKELQRVKGELDGINVEIEQFSGEIEQSTKGMKEITKQMQHLEKATGKTVDELANMDMPLKPSIIEKSLNFVKSGFNSAMVKLTKGWDRLKESSKQIGINIAQRLNPANWLKALKNKIRGFGDEDAKKMNKGIGSLVGKLGFLAIGLGFLTRLLKNSQPIQEKIKEIMDKLMPVFTMIVNALMPLFDALIKILMPPLLKLLGFLVKLLGRLLITLGKVIKFMVEFPTLISLSIKRMLPKALGGISEQEYQLRLKQKEYELSKTNKVWQFADTLVGVGEQLLKSGQEISKINWNQLGKKETATSAIGGVSKKYIPGTILGTKTGVPIVKAKPTTKEEKTVVAQEKTAENTDDIKTELAGQRHLQETQVQLLKELKDIMKNMAAKSNTPVVHNATEEARKAAAAVSKGYVSNPVAANTAVAEWQRY